MDYKPGTTAKLVAVFAAMTISHLVQAQVLEEIVVTAQRRTQSLQEVPISIETISGAEIAKQGYRDLDDVASTTPGILIDTGQNDTIVTIRGFGTTGNALTREQAAPIFLDGVHLSRASQAKLAFLDVDRIEILKGPQPIYFGMNASAGAFNIQSRMPTPEWEANFNSEVGLDFNRRMMATAGVGGPISDTLGIRVSGKYEKSDGFLEDLIDGNKFPHQEDFGGRAILRWTPSDQLTVTGKVEAIRIDAGSAAGLFCTTGASMLWTGTGAGQTPNPTGSPRSLYVDAPLGTNWSQAHKPLPTTDADCFKTRVSRSNEGPYYDVPDNVHSNEGNNGMVDHRRVAAAWFLDESDPYHHGKLWDSILGQEQLDSLTTYVDLTYGFSNDIEVSWLSAFSKYDRLTSEENFDSPLYENNQIRSEDYDQISSELRFTSPVGGMFEWMAALSIQDATYDIVNGNIRSTVRRGMRINQVWEDQTWKNAFGTVTFNFLDNKASVDVGARYSVLDKKTYTNNYGRQYIFNIFPASVSGPTSGLIQVTNPAEHNIYLPYDPAAGLWYYRWRAQTNVPVEWRGTEAGYPVGLTAPIFGAEPGNPYVGDFGNKEFDPQITLRYRPADNHSLFFRWAEASKAGGFDTGQTSAPATVEDYAFQSEYAETYEIGAKGTLWDGRARYDVSVFELTFTDLQVSSATGNIEDPFVNINAGEQRNRGIELSTQFAVSEQMNVSLTGALMKGEMLVFPNAGCTTAERFTAGSGCMFPPGAPNGVIDRSGQQSAFTPDWNLMADLDYWMPVLDGYTIDFAARGFISDGYFMDNAGFSKVLEYDTHGDLSLSLGLGPQDDTWRVSVYGRNLFEPRQKYDGDLDIFDDGFLETNVGRSNFTTYGVKFEYNYR